MYFQPSSYQLNNAMKTDFFILADIFHYFSPMLDIS